jgi:CRP/FNR family cyclic AMP-dependent transcriptional regulator
MACSEMIDGLRVCELFGPLDQGEVEDLAASLADSCQMETYEAGETIFAQGDHTTRLYILADGQVLLQRTFSLGGRTASTPVALLGKGRAMGWTSLLYGPHEATASAVCQKPARVISIDGPVLRSVLENDPGIGFRVMGQLACMLGDRLRAAYIAMETHL